MHVQAVAPKAEETRPLITVGKGERYRIAGIGGGLGTRRIGMPDTGSKTVVIGLEDGPRTPDSQLYLYGGAKRLAQSGPLAKDELNPGPLDYHPAKVSVYFSPTGGAQDAITREIEAARQSILIQAYSFTSAPIAKALTDAQKRGVKIEAVLDKSNETARYTSATFLANAGASVLIDHKPAIAHSKVLLIDGATIITGSFNFSKAAEEKNAENLLVIKDAPEVFKAYEENFRKRAAESRPYQRKNAPPAGEAETEGQGGQLQETPATGTTTPGTAAPDTSFPGTAAKAPAAKLVNINTATAKELEKLPDVGKVTAERIIEHREQNGPFKSVNDLGKIKGIGKATLEKLLPLVTVE
jgi:comEA protein